MKRIHLVQDLQAEIFDALAHPTRLAILEMLRGGEVCVCELQAKLGQRQAYVSQHLMALRRAGLVTSRKEGIHVFYELSTPAVLLVLDAAQTVLYERSHRPPGPEA